MAVTDLYQSYQPDAYVPGGGIHVNFNQPDAAGNYYSFSDLPPAPAGKQWVDAGMGNAILMNTADVPTYQATVAAGPTRAQMEAQSKEQAKYASIAEGMAAPKSAEIQNALNAAAQRAIDAGGINVFDPYEVARDRVFKLQQQLSNRGLDPATTADLQNQLAEASAQMQYYSPTSKGSMGGDRGFTGASITAGQQAAGAAQNAAQDGAAAMGAAADAAALGAQPGYGQGETARQLARALAESSTPAYTPSTGALQAMSEASPAMQGTEGTAGLPTEPLTPQQPSIGQALGNWAKGTTTGQTVGNIVNVGKSVANALSNQLSSNAGQGAFAPTTPSAGQSYVGPTPYSTPQAPTSAFAPPPQTTTPKPTTATKPTQAFAPQGKANYSAQNALEESLKKARQQSLGRNIEFGFHSQKSPFKGLKSFQ